MPEVRTGPPKKRPPLRPVVGLDFGTCFSKIVVRDENWRIVEVVRERDGGFLIPAVIGLHQGMLYGPYAVTPANAVPYLKIHALCLDNQRAWNVRGPTELEALRGGRDWKEVLHAMLAWYFAHLVALTRSHLRSTSSGLNEFDDRVADSRDQIAFNLCIPVIEMQQSRAAATLLSALRCADLLYDAIPDTMMTRAPLEEWMEACRATQTSEVFITRQDMIFGYPEVAAGVQAVLQRPAASDGIYITADVGGGTLDLNVFCRNTGQRLSGAELQCNDLNYYAARVGPWGSERIAGNPHPFRHLARLRHVAASGWGLDVRSEGEVVTEVRHEVEALLALAKRKQRNHRTAAGSTYDSARIFLWGGGASHPCYGRAIAGALQGDLTEPATILNLPIPEDLPGVRDNEAGRLAVAYGLSFNRVNMEKVRPPDDTPDMPDDRRPHRPDSPNDPGFSWTRPGFD